MQELEQKIKNLIHEKDSYYSNLISYKKDIRVLFEDMYKEKIEYDISDESFNEQVLKKWMKWKKNLNKLYAKINLNKQIALYQEKKEKDKK